VRGRLSVPVEAFAFGLHLYVAVPVAGSIAPVSTEHETGPAVFSVAMYPAPVTVSERVAAMRRGELTLEQCAAWAARYPEQVPLLNGEFEYLAAFTPEALE
jgi:hypothetical protein